jgi:nicotinamidase-related amidase
MTSALIVIDVQQGFTDASYWGNRNNPDFEANLDSILDAWTVAAIEPALLVTKNVNSAFYGEPDLQAWLDEQGIRDLVICGIQTNMCVETTARMAGNLGYDVTVAIDATHTFDLTGSDGSVLTADELSRATAVNLSGGGFAKVVTTAELLG